MNIFGFDLVQAQTALVTALYYGTFFGFILGISRMIFFGFLERKSA
jgi:hypothetical protein